MGIGDVDSLLDGRLPPLDWNKQAFTGQAANVWHSPLYVAGSPGAGSVPSAGVNGAPVLNGRTGTLLAPAAAAGKSCYLNAVDFSADANVRAALLVDRLWENSGLSVTSTGSQAIVPAQLPPRDANGGLLGVGVFLALEVVTSLGAATGTVTVTYTNSDGVAGRTAVVTVPTSCVAGTLLLFPLQSGDYGVRFPTAAQNSISFVSGTYSLVMMRRLGRKLRAASTNPPDYFGPADGGHGVADGIAPQFIYQLSGTAAGASDATVQFTQA